MSNDDPTQPLLSSNPNANASGPLPSPAIPFPNRVLDFLSVWTLKALFRAYTTLLHLLSLLRLRPRPSLVKTYPCAPHSPVRVFLPPKSNAARPPPLLISIHGGSFALGHPIIDDPDAHLYATHHGLAVANIGYRLAPQSRFPGPAHDAAALIAALLADASLPVDLARGVAVCGYSAGANLALAATQLLPANARPKAVVAFYPVVDFALDHAARVARAQRGPARGAPNQHFGWVRWAYVREGQNLRDPLLSPVFAARRALPEKVCLVGCELDMLCAEAEYMAEGLARGGGEGERKAEGEGAWRTRNVRWEKVAGQVHGFNQFVSFGEGARVARARTERMHADVARWLFEEVYAQ
ncbi:Neutral cholesterol ester hydrolase 1 [Botryosphaeria dothidea]|uniref:Neutral cholesterol ester hydrolase 1 n=1 Tax=Botryosphaeria dothidea TaxID=55169 RepID=A0A8H4N0Q3_9PEZI|nr:Neutral cholesterol ester hydrolase 1 [Botryosphaeria dothidea]